MGGNESRTFELIFKDSFKKDFKKKVDNSQKSFILGKIEEMKNWRPETDNNCTAIVSKPGTLRKRIGDWRITLIINNNQIISLNVERRNERTYK